MISRDRSGSFQSSVIIEPGSVRRPNPPAALGWTRKIIAQDSYPILGIGSSGLYSTVEAGGLDAHDDDRCRDRKAPGAWLGGLSSPIMPAGSSIDSIDKSSAESFGS